MGYDFMLMRMDHQSADDFPIPCDSVTDDECGGPLPWTKFRSWLLAIGGHENGRVDSIWVDYGGEIGTINYGGGGEGEKGDCSCIYLDVHAEWEKVLEAFDYIQKLEPNSCLLDPQTGMFHDRSTFEKLL